RSPPGRRRTRRPPGSTGRRRRCSACRQRTRRGRSPHDPESQRTALDEVAQDDAGELGDVLLDGVELVRQGHRERPLPVTRDADRDHIVRGLPRVRVGHHVRGADRRQHENAALPQTLGYLHQLGHVVRDRVDERDHVLRHDYSPPSARHSSRAVSYAAYVSSTSSDRASRSAVNASVSAVSDSSSVTSHLTAASIARPEMSDSSAKYTAIWFDCSLSSSAYSRASRHEAGVSAGAATTPPANPSARAPSVVVIAATHAPAPERRRGWRGWCIAAARASTDSGDGRAVVGCGVCVCHDGGDCQWPLVGCSVDISSLPLIWCPSGSSLCQERRPLGVSAPRLGESGPPSPVDDWSPRRPYSVVVLLMQLARLPAGAVGGGPTPLKWGLPWGAKRSTRPVLHHPWNVDRESVWSRRSGVLLSGGGFGAGVLAGPFLRGLDQRRPDDLSETPLHVSRHGGVDGLGLGGRLSGHCGPPWEGEGTAARSPRVQKQPGTGSRTAAMGSARRSGSGRSSTG